MNTDQFEKLFGKHALAAMMRNWTEQDVEDYLNMTGYVLPEDESLLSVIQYITKQANRQIASWLHTMICDCRDKICPTERKLLYWLETDAPSELSLQDLLEDAQSYLDADDEEA